MSKANRNLPGPVLFFDPDAEKRLSFIFIKKILKQRIELYEIVN